LLDSGLISETSVLGFDDFEGGIYDLGIGGNVDEVHCSREMLNLDAALGILKPFLFEVVLESRD
jgi:hypothetical protein